MQYELKLNGVVNDKKISHIFQIKADNNISALLRAEKYAVNYLDVNNLIKKCYYVGGNLYAVKDVCFRDIDYHKDNKWYHFILNIL